MAAVNHLAGETEEIRGCSDKTRGVQETRWKPVGFARKGNGGGQEGAVMECYWFLWKNLHVISVFKTLTC